jgi:hypothetical protein
VRPPMMFYFVEKAHQLGRRGVRTYSIPTGSTSRRMWREAMDLRRSNLDSAGSRLWRRCR